MSKMDGGGCWIPEFRKRICASISGVLVEIPPITRPCALLSYFPYAHHMLAPHYLNPSRMLFTFMLPVGCTSVSFAWNLSISSHPTRIQLCSILCPWPQLHESLGNLRWTLPVSHELHQPCAHLRLHTCITLSDLSVQVLLLPAVKSSMATWLLCFALSFQYTAQCWSLGSQSEAWMKQWTSCLIYELNYIPPPKFICWNLNPQ